MASRPNIVFIFTDDQRFDTLSTVGNPEIETPNLDRLVARGTTFTHAHIMGGTSPAVCMPSRAMMLTGRTLFSIDRQGQRIPVEHTAMPAWFRANGYATAHVGKWHQDRESHARCFSTGAKIFGFNRKGGWYEACNGHWHIPVHDFDPTGEYAPDGGYNDPPVTPFEAPFETTKEKGRHCVRSCDAGKTSLVMTRTWEGNSGVTMKGCAKAEELNEERTNRMGRCHGHRAQPSCGQPSHARQCIATAQHRHHLYR